MRTAIRFDLLVALFLLFPAFFVSGQTDSRPCPDFLLTDADMSVELPALDVASAWLRAGREEAELGKHLYGIVQSGSADLAPAADTEIHVAAVRIANAMGVSLHFDDSTCPLARRCGSPTSTAPGRRGAMTSGTTTTTGASPRRTFPANGRWCACPCLPV